MKRHSRTRVHAQVLAVLIAAVVLIALLFVLMPATSVRAVDPTLDAAMRAIWEATRNAQQTRDVRDAEIANQRLTATALENQQRQLAISQTQTAVAQTATAEAQNATATAAARGTMTVQAQATATARAGLTATARSEATLTAQAQQTATARAEATRTAQAQQTASAATLQARETASAATLQAQATATRTALIVATEQRNAQLAVYVIAIAISAVILVLTVWLIRWALLIRSKPIVIVEESKEQQVPVKPVGAATEEVQCDGVATAPVRIVADDGALARELDKLFVEANDVDTGDTPPTE